MTQNRMFSICEIICEEAMSNVVEIELRYSYAKMLLDKSVQMDPAERDQFIRCISEILEV